MFRKAVTSTPSPDSRIGEPPFRGSSSLSHCRPSGTSDSARSRRLKSSGFKIAVDDFGTGYSSLSYLRKLPVDIVKIDGSFVRKVAENPENQLFVRTLLGFADGFGLESVAECVETQADADLLTQLGVKYIQGYHCGRPALERLWLPEGDRERDSAIDWAGGSQMSMYPSRRAFIRGIPMRSPTTPRSSANARSGDVAAGMAGVSLVRLVMTKRT